MLAGGRGIISSMRIEQVALPVLRGINKRPWLAPVLDALLQPWNSFSPALNVDPYPSYEALRAKGPILWHRTFNSWMVSSFEL